MKTNTYQVTIPEKCFSGFTGAVMDSSFPEFVQQAGGALAISLFEGKFQSALYSYLQLAQARGREVYHKELVAKGKKDS